MLAFTKVYYNNILPLYPKTHKTKREILYQPELLHAQFDRFISTQIAVMQKLLKKSLINLY